MKQFFTVFKFELLGYIKSKTYILTTSILSLLIIAALTIPTFFNTSDLSSGLVEGITGSKENQIIAVYDDSSEKSLNPDYVKAFFQNSEVKIASSKDEVKNLVKSKDVDAGFIVTSPLSYTYVVENNSMTDPNQSIFEEALSKIYRDTKFSEMGVNSNEIESIYSTPITADVDILGKDSASNFAYTYILIMMLYFLVIFYGQMIAVSVTTEKSNRAIELLVTSTSSNSLIFGKVISAALAGLIQASVVLAAGGITYNLNSSAWGGKLDMIFNIPSNVLLCFAIFGVCGYLFYAFIFGALGALVSRPEDINSSAGSITLIYVLVFLAVMFGLNNPGSSLMKVLSFLPFGSFMAMFVRVAMGTVTTLEVISSFAILLVSTALVGICASKIYRRGTLMYGNPIKIRHALKWIGKKQD